MRNGMDDIPELLLEQYALGELSTAERERVEGALARDGSVRARLEAIKDSDAEILSANPPRDMAAAIRRRMLASVGAREGIQGDAADGAPKPSSFRFPYRASLGLAAAAAVFIVFGVFMLKGPLSTEGGEATRMKGASGSILVYRQSAAGPSLLADGQGAAAGDLLQIKYSSGSARFGAIASLDGRGTITWHLPPLGAAKAADAKPAALLPMGAALSSAYELDDAPGFERFFLFSSMARFDMAAVERSLKALSASADPATAVPALPRGVEYASLLLRKEGGR